MAGNDATATLLPWRREQRMHAHHLPMAAPWYLALSLDAFCMPHGLYLWCWPDVQGRQPERRDPPSKRRVPLPPRSR